MRDRGRGAAARIGNLLFVGFLALGRISMPRAWICDGRSASSGNGNLACTDLPDVALSDFETAALSASAPAAIAGSGPAKPIKSPAAKINADPALALIVMWNLPIGRRPAAKKDPAACPQRGRNRESSGNTGQKLGNGVAADVCRRAFCRRGFPGGAAPGASLRNRCYEPAVRAAGRPDSLTRRPSGGAGCLLRQDLRSRLRDRIVLM